MQSDPPGFGPKIQYFTHENTYEQITPFFPGLKKEDLPDGEGWAVEMVNLVTHNGTHLDAPYHFHSTMDAKNGGRPSSRLRGLAAIRARSSVPSSDGAGWQLQPA